MKEKKRQQKERGKVKSDDRKREEEIEIYAKEVAEEEMREGKSCRNDENDTVKGKEKKSKERKGSDEYYSPFLPLRKEEN